jgi:hypothetical protein
MVWGLTANMAGAQMSLLAAERPLGEGALAIDLCHAALSHQHYANTSAKRYCDL